MTAQKHERAKEKSEPLKPRLVTLGREMLEREGLDALTLRALGERAGVSHMAAYRHFANKEALLAAIAEDGFRALAKAMEGVGKAASDPRERMYRIGVAYVAFARRHPALYRLMFGPAITGKVRFEGLADAGDAAYRVNAEAVAAFYEGESGGDQGEGGGDEALLGRRSIAMWALVHGLAHLLLDGRISLPEAEDEGFETAVRAILGAL